tara:strand:- start:789 stop:1169 length:381 start_codon:yes stop_codon:yes gene_type:complete
MGQNRRIIRRKKATLADVGTSDQQTIILSDKKEAYFLLAIRFVRTGGSGSNYQLRVRRNSGGTNGDIDEIYTGASTAVATATNDVADQPIPFDTDSEGKVYFKTGFDGGADNDYEYVIWFEKAAGS